MAAAMSAMINSNAWMSTYVDRSCLLVIIEVDFGDHRTGKQVVVFPGGNRTIVCSGSAISRLIATFDRDWPVECSIGIATIRLRLRGETNGVPPSKEVVCKCIGQEQFHEEEK